MTHKYSFLFSSNKMGELTEIVLQCTIMLSKKKSNSVFLQDDAMFDTEIVP